MGTYIRTCAEIKTADGWQPVGYGAFPPELWHDMDGYEAPAYSEPFKDQNCPPSLKKYGIDEIQLPLSVEVSRNIALNWQ